MIKKSVYILTAVVLVIFVLVLSISKFQKNKNNNIESKYNVRIPDIVYETGEHQNTSTPKITSSVKNGYKSVWVAINNNDKILLGTNLEKKDISKHIATKNSCAHLINGGFYDKNNKHIGLLIIDEEILNAEVKNLTFNGFFNITKDKTASVTRFPALSPRISIQTGPILYENGKKVDLPIEIDENARRIAVGVSLEKRVIFMAFYEQENSFSGPTLQELPDLIELVNREDNLNLKDVINLDGGAHSAFLTDLIKLSEASTIGSYFCVKP